MPYEFEPRVALPTTRTHGKFFILAFEGEQTEANYFEDFEKFDTPEYLNKGLEIKIERLEREQKGDGPNPKQVMKRLRNYKSKKEYILRDFDELWLIIDRDNWEMKHNINFKTLFDECNKEGNFFMALSNPCFELWLLLHWKGIEEYEEVEQRKISENKKVQVDWKGGKVYYLEKILTDEYEPRGIKGHYNKKDSAVHFLSSVVDAIQRAKALDNPPEDYPTRLGSHVYKLMEKLIKPELLQSPQV